MTNVTATLLLLLLISSCRATPALEETSTAPAPSVDPDIQLAYTLDQGPGNLTITPGGRHIFSLHQFYTPERVLAQITGPGAAGRLAYFPARGEGMLGAGLAAVLGIRSDTAGTIYILDNGSSAKAPPKLVLWDTRTNRVTRTIPLADASDANSFLNDFAFDYRRNMLYMSDPAGGPNAALVVVNLGNGTARRVLEGHSSVVPENIEFAVEGKIPTRKHPDGRLEKVKIGVDGIGIDQQHEWVYYGPLHGRSMYRIRAADLANPDLPAAQLATRVERYSDKPPSDGIAIDMAGNIYLGDLPGNAIGVITPDRRYRELVRRADLQWVDDFEFDDDGMLYVVTTQLHLSPELNAGKRAVVPPFRIFRMRPLAAGHQGY